MKANLYISLFLLTLFSCTKFGKNIFVSGRVINPVTNKGIPDIEVDLLKTSETFSLSSGFKSVKSVYTDENGRFEINHLGGTKSYTVAVRTPASFHQLGWVTETGYNTQDLGVKIGKRINVDYHALPFGKLNTHTQNINCQSPSDSMQVRGKTDYTPYTSFGYIYRTGCYDYTSTTPSKVPMGYLYVETKVIRSGVTTYVYDTAFVSESGTSFLEILY